MDKSTYDFKSLEQKYSLFIAPSFEITVGRSLIDSSKIPVSGLTVDMDCGTAAGGCSFTIESQYNYETSDFGNSLLDKIKIGEVLKIKVGYVVKKEIFFGYIDSFTVDYTAQGAPRIEVNGIDAKAYLMSRREIEYFSSKPPAEAIRGILSACVSAGYAKSVTVGNIKPFEAQMIRRGMDANEFVTELANLYGLNYFVLDGEIIFDDVCSFTSPLTTLTFGEYLLGFTKTCSLGNQAGKITYHSNDPKTGEELNGTAASVTLSGSGSTAVQTASKFSDTELDFSIQFAATEDECRRLAQIHLNRESMKYVSGKGRCLGIPELIPGRYIKVAGMDERTDGVYFISKVRHQYSSEGGYHCTFDIQGARSK